MASKKKQKVHMDGIHMSRTLKEICEADKIRHQLEGIPVGKVLLIPSNLADRDENRMRRTPTERIKVKFRVVAKTKNMLVCERGNGTRECFSFGDLVILQKKYGGLIDGKSE